MEKVSKEKFILITGMPSQCKNCPYGVGHSKAAKVLICNKCKHNAERMIAKAIKKRAE